MASKTEGLSVRARIKQAVTDSEVEHHRPASRQWLCQTLNLTFGVVDEHLKNLKADGEIYNEIPGYYRVVPDLPPDRPVSVTVLNNGMRKVEVGDEVWQVTPHEWAVIGDLASGANQRMAQREGDREIHAAISVLKARVKELGKVNGDLVRTVAKLQGERSRRTPDLFEA